MKANLIVPFFLFMLIVFPVLQVHGVSEDVYIQINLWSNELRVIKNNQVMRRYPISPGD